MKLYNYKDLTQQKVKELCSRKVEDDNLVFSTVKDIVNAVKNGGDTTLLSYAEQFDKVKLSSLFIGKAELAELAHQTPESVKNAIDIAYQNIYKFHETQLQVEAKVETMPGVNCWRETRAIEKVGLYIPGGTAVLPSTFLMLGIPAKIAGCKEIVVCSPPQNDGKINCYIAYVSTLLDIEKVYLVGGAQAVSAMAFGTQTIPQVDKIFGPGNRYVTEAKKMVQNTVSIDMPAGPSEVLIIADETANAAFVAADLLAQAEHGSDSQAILVSTSQQIIEEVIMEVEKQIIELPRKDMAARAMANSYIVFAETVTQAMDFSNTYAPEHLILACNDFEPLIPFIINAGSVFLGNLTPESAGDYASGTNHTLPTSGFARAYSGVSVDTFLKKITFQHLSAQGLHHIGPTVEVLAAAEGLQAHKNAITIRLKENKN
ncbi:histidinol dehydrogenase [Pedobacter insulae]|uniref:Histidinol dehydrogenase n=1 Tax=Pedobacter insulae TaxID=414048 RepID=A0A1I2VK97_9SPHI|nr:histidinol dehydrogenase [Pedobacter insulae]SFG89734.1 histidinol dehydrogenase [Pedobacter insulae]